MPPRIRNVLYIRQLWSATLKINLSRPSFLVRQKVLPYLYFYTSLATLVFSLLEIWKNVLMSDELPFQRNSERPFPFCVSRWIMLWTYRRLFFLLTLFLSRGIGWRFCINWFLFWYFSCVGGYNFLIYWFVCFNCKMILFCFSSTFVWLNCDDNILITWNY